MPKNPSLAAVSPMERCWQFRHCFGHPEAQHRMPWLFYCILKIRLFQRVAGADVVPEARFALRARWGGKHYHDETSEPRQKLDGKRSSFFSRDNAQPNGHR